jgi:hypothetical protein
VEIQQFEQRIKFLEKRNEELLLILKDSSKLKVRDVDILVLFSSGTFSDEED